MNILRHTLSFFILLTGYTLSQTPDIAKYKIRPFIFTSIHTDFLHVSPNFPVNYGISGSSKLFDSGLFSEGLFPLIHYNYNMDRRLGLGLETENIHHEFWLSFSTILNQHYNFFGTKFNEQKHVGYKLFSGSQIYTLGGQKRLASAGNFSFYAGVSIAYEYFKAIRYANLSDHWSNITHSVNVSGFPGAQILLWKYCEFKLRCYPYFTWYRAKFRYNSTPNHISNMFVNYRASLEFTFTF